MVKQKGDQIEKLKNSDAIKKRLQDKLIKDHPSINFCLPHEFGGLGDPLEPRYS